MSFLHPTAALSRRRLAAPGNPFDPDGPHRTDRPDGGDFAPGHDKT